MQSHDCLCGWGDETHWGDVSRVEEMQRDHFMALPLPGWACRQTDTHTHTVVVNGVWLLSKSFVEEREQVKLGNVGNVNKCIVND